MTTRQLLEPNKVYIRDLNPDSNLLPAIQIDGGVINVYNQISIELGSPPPQSKNDMTIDDFAQNLGEGTWKITGLSDYFLYEKVSGNPKVFSMNLVK